MFIEFEMAIDHRKISVSVNHITCFAQAKARPLDETVIYTSDNEGAFTANQSYGTVKSRINEARRQMGLIHADEYGNIIKPHVGEAIETT